jgi:hypothetical protein
MLFHEQNAGLTSPRAGVFARVFLGVLNVFVDVLDLIIVAKALGTHPGDPKSNPNADINGDGEIDIPDLIWVAKYLRT